MQAALRTPLADTDCQRLPSMEGNPDWLPTIGNLPPPHTPCQVSGDPASPALTSPKVGKCWALSDWPQFPPPLLGHVIPGLGLTLYLGGLEAGVLNGEHRCLTQPYMSPWALYCNARKERSWAFPVLTLTGDGAFTWSSDGALGSNRVTMHLPGWEEKLPAIHSGIAKGGTVAAIVWECVQAFIQTLASQLITTSISFDSVNVQHIRHFLKHLKCFAYFQHIF